MRRSIHKLFRLKNILIFTLVIILVYSIRTFGLLTRDLPQEDYILAKPEALKKSADEIILISNLDSDKKIDWHDYKYIEYEASRKGIGEHGVAASLADPKTGLSVSQERLERELYAVNGFNGALSDKISVNRSIPDIRHPGCKHKKYLASLQTVSVIIPFHNEHWSTLLRTVHSVINRSPDHLIKEIFLVDDASTKDFLGDKLDEYLQKNLKKVKVVRLHSRSGLITARLAGAKFATGDVLIFLDSHTEANVNWLPPLLEPIAMDYRTVMCPFIDVVAYDTFEYRAQDEGARGAFDWEFFYKRLPVLPADEKNMPEPFKSPVMAGGLFAISYKWFWELGGYDDGLDIWGGEQYELSFKLWQCGGQMLDAPCSRIGHIYRKFAPFPNPGHGDFVGKNYKRVAEVWMDEYAQYLYERRPQYKTLEPGDLTRQKAIRTKLKCKSFRWYITQIAFDLPGKYPPVEPHYFGDGKINSVAEPHLCIDARHGEQMKKLYLSKCNTSSGELEFQLSWHKDIRSKTRAMCWDLPESKPRSPILLYSCHLGGGNQLWRYLPATKQLVHGGNENCIEYDQSTHYVFINHCDEKSETQRWNIERLDYEMLGRWEELREQITGPVEHVTD